MVGVVGNLGAGFLAARIGRRALLLCATALGCALLVAMLESHGVWIWVSIAGLGIALFATLPITVVMGQDLLPRHPSLGSGLALGFSNAVGALGVGALGLLAARWGASGVLWGIEACGLGAIALATLL
jgi:FSR family fosmidomycin resistance protein-like MFS transporter